MDPTVDPMPGRRWPRQPAVLIRDPGVRYDLRLTKRTTLKGSLAGMFRRNEGHENHFWALRHLDLTLAAHGESSWPTIGPNGAGKSIAARWPSPGSSRRARGRRRDQRQRVSALLHPRRRQIRDGPDRARHNTRPGRGAPRHLAERHGRLDPGAHRVRRDIGPFIDAPVKTYSTGDEGPARLRDRHRRSRPDILLLDEVPGTGDQTLRRAQPGPRVRELCRQGPGDRPGHPRPDLRQRVLANRAILLEKGQLIHEGRAGRGRRALPRPDRPPAAARRGDAQRFAAVPTPAS